jgi:eukaryotic-like serine/threonine-protein kinase
MAGWDLREGDPIAPGLWAVRLLGGGSRYEAYLAWDDRLRALVVAKVVRPDKLDDGPALRALAGEVRMLERLAHPMLLRSFGHVLDGPRPHLILEFLEGPRLSTLVRRHGAVVEQLVPLALNLCSVLHYLEGEGVVHLDVKPSNVVMAGEPKLIDLSVARTLEELRDLRRPVGTAPFMAPEQCDPERFAELGPPADVWGLGATLYTGFARKRPFRPTDEEKYPQLRAAPPPLPDTVPDAIARLIAACLEPRPADRPRAGELADALEPLADALPAPRLGKLRPTPRRLLRDSG